MLAKEGTIWMCGACGKTHMDHMKVGDESCYMNASLVYEASIVRDVTGRAVSAQAVKDSDD